MNAVIANLSSEASRILDGRNLQDFEDFVGQLHVDSIEHENASALLDYCSSNFANLLTVKLLQVYESSSIEELRFRSITVLSGTVEVFSFRRFELSLHILPIIKPLMIRCLTVQETNIPNVEPNSDIKFLREIVTFVAFNVVRLDHSGWDELSDCIYSLADREPLKAFHVFLYLPPINPKFIYRVITILLEKAEIILLDPVEA